MNLRFLSGNPLLTAGERYWKGIKPAFLTIKMVF